MNNILLEMVRSNVEAQTPLCPNCRHPLAWGEERDTLCRGCHMTIHWQDSMPYTDWDLEYGNWSGGQLPLV